MRGHEANVPHGNGFQLSLYIIARGREANMPHCEWT